MKFIIRWLRRRQLWQLIAILSLDIVVYGGTNINSAPSYMLIVGFVLLLATIYQLLGGLLSAGRVYGIRLRHKRRLSLYLTAVVGVLIALQSIGELSPRDAAVLLPLAIVGYLYSSYSTANQRPT